MKKNSLAEKYLQIQSIQHESKMKNPNNLKNKMRGKNFQTF